MQTTSDNPIAATLNGQPSGDLAEDRSGASGDHRPEVQPVNPEAVNGGRKPAINMGGAPVGNRNATKHGLKSAGAYSGFLTIGSAPDGAAYVKRTVVAFRRALEIAVIEKCGELDLYAAAIVQSACRHEGRAILLTRWLREIASARETTTQSAVKEGTDGATTKVSKTKQIGGSMLDRVNVLREIGLASDARDRCLEKLGLDKRATPTVWDALHRSPGSFDQSQADRASNAAVGDQEGDCSS